MRIQLSSIMVSDQTKALRFYTEKLGFVEKHNIPMGEFSWITLVSPEAPDGVELVLEPNENPAALAFTTSLREQGIPLTAFLVDDAHAEYARLQALGVAFRAEPKLMGPVTAAVLDDTCGNWIQIYSENAGGGAAAAAG